MLLRTSFQLALAITSVTGVGARLPDAIETSKCAAGMDGTLPSPTPADFKFSGNVRKYYIAAEEVEWNYAPTGWDNWLGVPMNVSPRAQDFIEFGTTYLKALYRGYTDSTFSTRSEQPAWQGTQGPTIRSEVGDLIEIMFVNNLTANYATIHSMGLAYTKGNEGSDYPIDSRPGQNQTIPVSDAVPPVGRGIRPGECVVYKWVVDDGAGPNDGAPSRAHSYHSYVDLHIDTNSGLIGPQIVYAPGMMKETMANYREFPLLYMIYDENLSFLSGQNAMKLASNKSIDGVTMWGNLDTETLWSGNMSVWQPQIVNLNSSGLWSEAPMYHSMNGYIFANNPPYEMCHNDKAIWYVNAYGGESHVFHMHGNGVVDNGRKQYAVSMNDGIGKTLFMNATGEGLWQVLCHVGDHHQHGMVSNYLVHGESCPLQKVQSCV